MILSVKINLVWEREINNMFNFDSARKIMPLVLSMFLFSSSSAYAEDVQNNPPGSVGNSKSSNSPNQTTAQSSSSGTPFGLAMIPGVCLGTAVGLPVCLARRFVHGAVSGSHGMVGDTENPLLVVPAAVIWSPLAFVTATMECPVYAIRNAWMADKPFSKEQFSLGEMPSYDD
jgi:hypothetical protein